MDNKEIYFVHEVLLSRLKSTIGYLDHVNMTRNFSHFALRKSVLTPEYFFAVLSPTKKYF